MFVVVPMGIEMNQRQFLSAGNICTGSSQRFQNRAGDRVMAAMGNRPGTNFVEDFEIILDMFDRYFITKSLDQSRADDAIAGARSSSTSTKQDVNAFRSSSVIGKERLIIPRRAKK